MVVTCLCISNRDAVFIKNTMENFAAQTYQNKELLIVSSLYNEAYDKVISEYPELEVKYFWLNNSFSTLGQMRNVAIEKATGDYICVWDDDDWYHCQRIERQMASIISSKKDGSVLPYYLLFDKTISEAYMSIAMPLPASIICKRGCWAMDMRYEEYNKGEDAMIISRLNKRNFLAPVVCPELYIYVYHGSNTWCIDHFKSFCGKKMSSENTKLIGKIVNREFSVAEGSTLLYEKGVIAEFDYFYSFLLDQKA